MQTSKTGPSSGLTIKVFDLYILFLSGLKNWCSSTSSFIHVEGSMEMVLL